MDAMLQNLLVNIFLENLVDLLAGVAQNLLF
jgi:hypothetical protein